MQTAFHLLRLATFLLLGLSALILVSAFGFGSAFVADFTIENQSTQSITVIPIGTVGADGRRFPLPVTISSYVNLPAVTGRSFQLHPGGTVAISYDMDDINFSEIVVQDQHAQFFQLITDPDPLVNQYHGPGQAQYVIEDLGKLQLASVPVTAAAKVALRGNSGILIFYGLLIAPWILYVGILFAMRKPTADVVRVLDSSKARQELSVDSRA